MKKLFYSVMMLMMAMLSSQYVNAANEAEVLFKEDFKTDMGDFTIEGDAVWYWTEESNTVKMIALGKAQETSYLVSPEIQLGTSNTFAFRHAVSYNFINDFATRSGVYVREIGGEWTKLEGVEYPTDQMQVSAAVDTKVNVPAEFENKKVQFAFGYCSVGDITGGQESWYINNVVVEGVKSAAPEPTPGEKKSVYEITFDSQEAVDAWTAEGELADHYDFKTFNNKGFMALNGYECKGEMAVTFVVSPKMQLLNSNTVTFDNTTFGYAAIPADQITALVVRTIDGEWKQIEGVSYGDYPTFVTSSDLVVPAEFDGKEVQFGFMYMNDKNDNCGFWYIKNFKVMGEETSSGIENIENEPVYDNKVYDLQGRMVKNPAHGLYIINGKKVVIK